MIVLLIIFMTITPLIREGPVRELPRAVNAAERAEGPREVGIGADATTYLDGVPLSNPRDLLPQLQLAWGDRRTDHVVRLKADERLAYSDVAQVMELCRAAGADEIALMVRLGR
jgi:biopolymer transport protein ExbD